MSVDPRRRDLERLSSPLGRALNARFVGCSAGPGAPLLRFALTEPERDSPWLVELERASGARSRPYWPVDEATLAARPPERVFTVAEDRLEGPGEVLALLRSTLRAARAPVPRPRIMGILNATPDSFSDGGQNLDPEEAIARGLAMVKAGAHILDVGGESTRPGSAPVALEEEWRRVGPILAGLAQATDVPLSIDTSKAEIARRALEAGATWINDVRAGTADPDMLPVAAAGNAHFVAMHCLAPSDRMQREVSFGDPVADVAAWLRERVAASLAAGLRADRIWLDPGIGFGKHLDHNLTLLRRLWELRSLGCPLLLGVSRKSFIEHLDRADGHPAGTGDPLAREGGTAAAVAACVAQGAAVLRVHDVATMGQAARLAYALQNPSEHATHP